MNFDEDQKDVGVRNSISHTVNVIIFAWGKVREHVAKAFHVGLISRILLLFPSQRQIGFIFAWGNFREEGKSAKNAKITPM